MSSVAHLSAHPDLPAPTGPRFEPVRAGIRNVWEYDNQEFWFCDGRLLLRGRNGSGKSKALEVLFPFVLDGETRSERLDPFGSQAKSMFWNLIAWHSDRRTAIGYCWAEFGRINDGHPEFVTVIIGLQASREGSARKKVNTWFGVSNKRIGLDLDVAPGGVPLTRDKFRDAIGEAGFETTADAHRRNVDAALFGLGPNRFQALIHLLLQLRRPKLSEKLDITRLSTLLSDALPPLEQRHLDDVAKAFAELDNDRAELAALDDARDAMSAFLEPFADYARFHVRRSADAVRNATTKFDGVAERARKGRETMQQADQDIKDAESNSDKVERELAGVTGALAALDTSKVEELSSLVERAKALRHVATTAKEDAERDESRSAAVATSAQRAALELERATTRVEEAAQAAARHATIVGISEQFAAQLPALSTTPDAAADTLRSIQERRQVELTAVRAAADELTERDRAAVIADGAVRDADLEQVEANGELRKARRALDDVATTLEAGIDTWLTTLIERFPDTDVVDDWSAHTVELLRQADGDETATTIRVSELCGPIAANIGIRRAGAMAEVRAEQADLAAATRDRTELLESIDVPPDPTPGRPRDRDAGGVALWACVDFEPDLTERERAGLEAALSAAGLLDALVTADGRLSAPESLDTTVLAAEPASVSVALWLTPVSGLSVSEEAIAAALAGIGARRGSAGCWVDLDGSWATPNLSGRWQTEAAEHIGAAARATRRERLIALLDERISAAQARLATAKLALAAAEAEAEALEESRAAFPPATPLGHALALVEAGESRLRKTQERLDAAFAAQRIATDARDRAQGALVAIETKMSVTALDLEAALEALGEFRSEVATAVAEARTLVRLRPELEGRRLDAAADAEAAKESATRARAANRDATTAEATEQERRATIGADAEAIVARQQELSEERVRLDELLKQLAQAHEDARVERATAKARLEATETEREEAEGARTDALASFAVICATPLAALALPTGIDEPDALRNITAGLNAARRTATHLRGVPTDDDHGDKVTNETQNAYAQLNRALGDRFNTHLETDGGVYRCKVQYNGDWIDISNAAENLRVSIEARRQVLTADERDIIEHHLLQDLGSHLADRVAAAWQLVDGMNKTLAEHPTSNGIRLHLRWSATDDAAPGATLALKLLRQKIALLNATERVSLAVFLRDQVLAAREGASSDEVTARLAEALDYRSWHTFTVMRRDADGTETRLSRRTQGAGSGGEQAKLAHLPLFAAAAAYYSSAVATAPRLLFLDEAFAGIDANQRADMLGMLVELDLDIVLTNYDEWACYPTVPGIAIYHLERDEEMPGVAAIRFLWNGSERIEADPFLDAQLADVPTPLALSTD
ncbi:MAG: TIGR02680 family protein [Gaiellaceae bacterium]